jgi:hypothetical protein
MVIKMWYSLCSMHNNKNVSQDVNEDPILIPHRGIPQLGDVYGGIYPLGDGYGENLIPISSMGSSMG